MAKSTMTTSNALTKKLWHEMLFKDVQINSYFDRFSGPEDTNIMQVVRDFEGSKGDVVTFGIVPRLNKELITNNDIEGNEAKLTDYNFTLSLQQLALAVRDDGKLSRQRAMYDIDAVSKSALLVNVAEKLDQKYMDTLTANPTKVFYPGGSLLTSTTTLATALTNITATDKITMDMFRNMKAWARTGGGRNYIPLRQVNVSGKMYMVFLCHPDTLADLQNDPKWSQAQREAELRGPDNPIFTGAEGVINGIAIHSHEHVSVGTDAGSTADVSYSQSMLLGAQALCTAWAGKPDLVTKEFQYDTEHGTAWVSLWGCAKPKFSSKDYGSVSIVTANSNIRGL